MSEPVTEQQETLLSGETKMFKNLLAVLFLFVAFVGSASASGLWGIVGGIGVNVGDAAPLIINLDGREIFTDEYTCKTALETLLKAPVTVGTSNTAGNYTGADPTLFDKVQVSKINMAVCLKTMQY